MNKALKFLLYFFLLALFLGVFFLATGYYTLYPKPYKNFDWEKVQFSETMPDELANKKDFSIITFNAGFLDLRIHGETKLMPTDHIETRVKATPAHLLPINADVIAFQEVYEKEHIDFLIKELKPTYPHYFFQHNSRLKLNNGLMLFSKYPLLDRKGMSQTEKGPLDEAWLADRSLLSAVIEVAGKRISIVDLHATSGGTLYNSDDDVINDMRARQVDKSIELAKSNNTEYQIILGDINAGPNVSSVNYQQYPSSGFVDAHLAHSQKIGKEPEMTWAGDNYHNAIRGYTGAIQQRIDLIFLSQALADEVTITDAKSLYIDNTVKISDELSVPLSDHYGVLVRFSF